MPSTDTPTREPTDLRDAPHKLRLLARWFDLRDQAHRPVVLDQPIPGEHDRCRLCDNAAEQVALGDEVQRDLRFWADEIEDQAIRGRRVAMALVLAVALGWLVGLIHAAMIGAVT
jgi:hypothetical protein